MNVVSNTEKATSHGEWLGRQNPRRITGSDIIELRLPPAPRMRPDGEKAGRRAGLVEYMIARNPRRLKENDLCAAPRVTGSGADIKIF
jgi:hypothetical protein